LTALEHFSSVLQSAQRNAADLAAEGGKCARTSHGKSERTIRRQKKALRDLQAQGFQTLPDFFRMKAGEAKKKAKFEAMVAAVKAQFKALQGREEEEESSETGTETGTETADEHDSDFEVISEPDMAWGSAPRDKAQPRSPVNAAALYTREATYAKEIDCAEEIANDPTAESSGAAQGMVSTEGGRTTQSCGLSNSDTCLESSRSMFEETEDDSDGNPVLDKSNESGSNPAIGEQGDLEVAWGTVLQMLEESDEAGMFPRTAVTCSPQTVPRTSFAIMLCYGWHRRNLQALREEKRPATLFTVAS
jgi:hypothetical protein